MDLKWTSKALSELVRRYEFLSPVNRQAAVTTVQTLTAAPAKLLAQPRIGESLDEFAPREVRRILVGHYEMRYEIQHSTIMCCSCGIREKADRHISLAVFFG